MGSASEGYSLSSEDHIAILQKVMHGRNAKESLIRSYGRSFNGFAAKLSEKESEDLKKMEGMVSVFPSQTFHVQTTRSWDFLGFPETAHKNTTAESDIIVGVIDSGIWPESASFRDDGFSPAPKKWKGVCQGGTNFTCNNKLIGARTYVGSTARDEDGHGSHMASIAAGRKVDNVSFYGLAEGSARGGVPSARIAAYRACNNSHCRDTDILAAFDDAIADGVDLITISVGLLIPIPFDRDGVSIGAFHAMDKGILTLQPGGNGASLATVDGTAPWIFTIAASSTDRRIITKVVLGDGKILTGNSVNSFSWKGDKLPLVYGEVASTSDCPDWVQELCWCLNETRVKGKIVACNDFAADKAVHAGALGTLSATYYVDVSSVLPLPGAELGKNEYVALLAYIKTTEAPVASILRSEVIINETATPVVAKFSSRGPNKCAADILKPDITAPGVEILAAYSPMSSVSDDPQDERSSKYNVVSGTSVSCAHVAGAVAYVKSLHPDWSPAAIKSALMTTAHPMSPSENPRAEFAYGSGHLNPLGATNPGLVYEVTKEDYMSFLCKIGYKDEGIRLISGDTNFTCPGKNEEDLFPDDINYPSMSAWVDYGSGKPFRFKFQRTVTNVGVANSTYEAKVESGSEIKVTVEPSTLSFKSLREQKSYNVTVVGRGLSTYSHASASLTWSDGIHSVRSPIIVYSFNFD